MSVWSSENDGHDRMQQVVAEAKADAHQRLTATKAKTAEVVKLLHDAARYGGLGPDECVRLADILEQA